jgi:Holliday junction DNA helicase RuvA
MIGYLRGQVMECLDGRLLLAVGPAESAVGYSVTVPQGPSYLSVQAGKPAELFVYTHVREDALDLYGFRTKSEKDVFLTLLTVNGIGPKLALAILSGAEAGPLVRAILEGDKDFLTRIPGVGKKTAERVVLELADPLRKKIESGLLADPRLERRASARSGTAKPEAAGAASAAVSIVKDAREALVGLGYRELEVTALLNRVMDEMEPPPARAEELIRTALKQLG